MTDRPNNDNAMTKRTINRGPNSGEKMTVTSFSDLDESEAELRDVMKQLNIPMSQDPTMMRTIKRQIGPRSQKVDYGEDIELQYHGV